jgi:hypothetical protein
MNILQKCLMLRLIGEAIVHKKLRSSDHQDAGNVEAVYADSIVIITEGAREEYKLPKSQVEGFDGAEAF